MSFNHGLWLPGVHLITGLSGSVHSDIGRDGDIEGMHLLTGISHLWSHLVQYEVIPRCVSLCSPVWTASVTAHSALKLCLLISRAQPLGLAV